MPLSTPNPTFLLDENVDSHLYKFLSSKDIDVKLASKGSSDKEIAKICLTENRILVTNDEDFQGYSDDEIYSVVWLRIPQSKPDLLMQSFTKLLSECNQFKGRIIVLYESDWKDFPLFVSLLDSL